MKRFNPFVNRRGTLTAVHGQIVYEVKLPTKYAKAITALFSGGPCLTMDAIESLITAHTNVGNYYEMQVNDDDRLRIKST